jgi:hypothetical protein
MSDQPFYAPSLTTTPRQPRGGEHLWAIEKNGRQLARELRDDGAASVELQVYRDRTAVRATLGNPRAGAREGRRMEGPVAQCLREAACSSRSRRPRRPQGASS